MEICEICGKTYREVWDVRVNDKNGENVYFCGEKCENRWNKKELGIY